MRNEYCLRESTRPRRSLSIRPHTDLRDWRRRTRPLILDAFVDQTRDLPWSRELIDAVLDELHVSDEFDELTGRIPDPSPAHYPQLLAIALVLRHSWFPEDLARITACLAPPTSSRHDKSEHL